MTVRAGKPVDPNGVCEHQDELDKLGKDIDALLKKKKAVEEDASLEQGEQQAQAIALANQIWEKRQRASELLAACGI